MNFSEIVKSTVKIGSEKYVVKSYSTRALMMWESMTGKMSTDALTTEDNIMYMYCLLKACNMDTFEFTYDEFIDEIDEDKDFLSKMSEALSKKK
jgi:hypothetical protein